MNNEIVTDRLLLHSWQEPDAETLYKYAQDPAIGSIAGWSPHTQENEAEIGYWIGVPHRGQGLIPEAVHHLLQRCLEDLGMTAVWCGYYDGNAKFRRVMEKCGFRFHHTETGKVSCWEMSARNISCG